MKTVNLTPPSRYPQDQMAIIRLLHSLPGIKTTEWISIYDDYDGGNAPGYSSVSKFFWGTPTGAISAKDKRNPT